MNNSDEKHIREIVDIRFDALEKLLDERIGSVARALDLKAVEYQRRLDQADRVMDNLQDFKAKMLGRMAVYAFVVPAIVGVASALLVSALTK